MNVIMQRLKRNCKDLKKLERRKIYDVNQFLYSNEKIESFKNIKSYKDTFKKFNTGETWGGYDLSGWFSTTLEIEKNLLNKTIALEVTTFGEGWDAINPQFLLFIDGKYKQGIDVNHREHIIDLADLKSTLTIDLQAYSGLRKDAKPSLALTLYEIDLDVRKLYFDLHTLMLCAEKMNDNDYNKIKMLASVDKALNIINFMSSDEFIKKESFIKASKFLETEIYAPKDIPYKVSGVGHTHIDVAWQWTVAQSREKAVRSFMTVVDLMTKYPEYKFMSSQPVLYKFVKEDHPEVYEKIKELVKQGRWETEGSMWVEPDTNLASGESLIRQILFGKRFFKDEFGVDNKILWLPDVFGYSPALPQIMCKTGIDYFMTTKISWNQYNKLPYDTFNWKGIDGSSVLTHMITTKEPYQKENTHFTTYNGEIHPGAIHGAWERYQQKDINDDILMSYGYGDGGGGVTYEMLEYGKRLAAGVEGMPQFQQTHALEFFQNLENKLSGKKIPLWNGELYLEYHRGTYTSTARNKRDNRKVEQLLLNAEKLNSHSTLNKNFYNQKMINENLETILLNQFHDILPGTCIKEVYDVTKQDYEKNIIELQAIIDDSISYITNNISSEDGDIFVYNTDSNDRGGFIEFTCDDKINSIEYENKNIPIQQTYDHKQIAYSPEISGLSFSILKTSEVKCNVSPLKFENNTFENNFYVIEFDEHYNIDNIFDKQASRSIINDGEKFNQLVAYQDRPIQFDNWDIDEYYTEKSKLVNDVSDCKILENGPIRTVLEITRKFQSSTIVQKVIMSNFDKKIDFLTNVDWKESQILLKTLFNSNLNTNKATFDVQFGNIERPTHKNTSWNHAQFEVCGHKWVDISEGNYGLTLLNDSKYGFNVHENTIGISLIKSGIEPFETTDQEMHEFTYSLELHNGPLDKVYVDKQASKLNNKLITKTLSTNKVENAIDKKFISISSENVKIDVVKKCEYDNDFIIRMHEFNNAHTKTSLSLNFETLKIDEVDMLETTIIKENVDINNITFKPFEIKTLKVKYRGKHE